ncbi:unnamed protein product [Ixodes persulcatus]
MARLGMVGIFLVFFVTTWTRRSEALDDHQLSQDLLDLKLMGLRLETKLTMIEGLVNRLNAQANKCAQNGRIGGGGESETEVATSDTQERILRAQQAIIDISNRNTVELENLSQLVVTQTSKLANRSDAMLGLLKSSRQPDIAAPTQGRRHPVDRHNV